MAFRAYFQSRKNTVFKRYHFWSRRQQEAETIDQWVMVLRTQAKNCEFGDQRESIIQNMLVFGIRDDRTKERLSREAKLTLQAALDICRAAEASQLQVQAMAKDPPQIEVHAMKAREQKGRASSHGEVIRQTEKHTSQWRYCGLAQAPRQCPAYGKTCAKCHQPNHFARVCQWKGGTAQPVHSMEHQLENKHSEEDPLFISQIFIGSMEDGTKWTEVLDFGPTRVEFKFDTGTSAGVLPYRTLQATTQEQNKTSRPHLEPTRNILTEIGRGKIRPRGVIRLPCTIPRRRPTAREQSLSFYVTDENLTILGRGACQQLDLVRRVDMVSTQPSLQSKRQLLEAYSEAFRGIGEYEREYHIGLTDDAIPLVQPARTVPYAKRAMLKKKLDELEKSGIIADVTRPTDWVHNLVVTKKKNGSMRLCLDPQPLNKANRREHHRIPTPTDVQTRLAGKQVSSVIDMRDAFWHVRLTEESSYLCTFNTSWGRKRFMRMPFGLSSASEVLQQRNDKTFGDIPNVHVVADDLIIAGKVETEQNETFYRVLERAKEKNIKFSPDKLQFKIPEVKYLGHMVSHEGIRPAPDKVEAIAKMPKPEDPHGVQRLLGMIKYLAAFIQHESDITAPLRELLKKEVQWAWNHEHHRALQKIKEVLTADPVLTFYDVHKQTVVQADASPTGMRACLLQGGRPVAYASRTLTQTERMYAQIEEMLSIVFTCNKFHPFIYGKAVVVQTDHKPLEIIVRKPLCKAPPRLQRCFCKYSGMS